MQDRVLKRHRARPGGGRHRDPGLLCRAGPLGLPLRASVRMRRRSSRPPRCARSRPPPSRPVRRSMGDRRSDQGQRLGGGRAQARLARQQLADRRDARRVRAARLGSGGDDPLVRAAAARADGRGRDRRWPGGGVRRVRQARDARHACGLDSSAGTRWRRSAGRSVRPSAGPPERFVAAIGSAKATAHDAVGLGTGVVLTAAGLRRRRARLGGLGRSTSPRSPTRPSRSAESASDHVAGRSWFRERDRNGPDRRVGSDRTPVRVRPSSHRWLCKRCGRGPSLDHRPSVRRPRERGRRQLLPEGGSVIGWRRGFGTPDVRAGVTVAPAYPVRTTLRCRSTCGSPCSWAGADRACGRAVSRSGPAARGRARHLTQRAVDAEARLAESERQRDAAQADHERRTVDDDDRLGRLQTQLEELPASESP